MIPKSYISKEILKSTVRPFQKLIPKSNPSKSKFSQKFLRTKGHLGSTKWTKDMANSLAGIRHGMSVFNAKKTKIACSRVVNFLKNFQKDSKLDILFVNTSEQYRYLVKKVALTCDQKYINQKWVGGTLTNWSQISQSYSLFANFHDNFGNFLKKRKIHLPLYEKARRIYSGLLPRQTTKIGSELFKNSTLGDGLPDILFLINPQENQNVLHEANLLKIPVIALTDSHTKISGIDYMIPGNVESIEFVYWCLNLITITLQKRNLKSSQNLTLSDLSDVSKE
jgi:small subunit ribosomal protein S2